MHCLDEQITVLEAAILKQARLLPAFTGLLTVAGICKVWALTIALETGDITRFDGPGKFASYARVVDCGRKSNGKKKGEGNAKCGNKHLS